MTITGAKAGENWLRHEVELIVADYLAMLLQELAGQPYSKAAHRFARGHQESFRLYRLFDFRSAPRLFELAGPIEQHCLLDATTFRASFG